MSNKKKDVLILDDKDYWAVIIEGAIKREDLPNCNTYVAMTYKEAITLIEARNINNMFQIALLDYSLSDSENQTQKTGYDVALKLRSLSSTASIYIVTLYDESYLRAKHPDFKEHLIRFIPKGDPELEATVIRELRESIEDMERDTKNH